MNTTIILIDGKEVIVDVEDLPRILKYSKVWRFNDSGYVTCYKKGGTRYLHKFVLKLHKKPFRHIKVDHKDLNRLNNSKSNLRTATKSQDGFNRRKHCDSTTGEKNVYFIKDKNSFRVSIMVDGKVYFGGYYKDKEDAVKRATELRNNLHGEFARHN